VARGLRLRVLRGQRPPVGDEPAPAPGGPTPPWRRLLRVPGPRAVAAALRRNTGLKLFSLLLAFVIWFMINVSERDAEGTFEMPIRVRSLAPGLIVTSQPAKPIAVTVAGMEDARSTNTWFCVGRNALHDGEAGCLASLVGAPSARRNFLEDTGPEKASGGRPRCAAIRNSCRVRQLKYWSR